jgi:hypothetical protein
MAVRLAGGLIMICLSGSADAALTAVEGPRSTIGPGSIPLHAGLPPAIVAAPEDVTDDAAHNLRMEAFDERQGVRLAAPLEVDGGVIEAGTLVDSHMIFLNTGPGDDPFPAKHAGVVWTFSGRILGVMSDLYGNLELASSDSLGAPGTSYPRASMRARGLETQKGGDAPWPDDGYTIEAEHRLRVSMSVSEPGDWIRVITESEPAAAAESPRRPDAVGLDLEAFPPARRYPSAWILGSSAR